MNRCSPDRWALLVLFLSTLVAGFAIADVDSPLRVVVVLGFLLFVPGAAIVRLLGFDELAVHLALGVGLSVSLGGITAGLLLYAGVWSSGATLAILIVIALTAVGVEVERATGRLSRDLRSWLVEAPRRASRFWKRQASGRSVFQRPARRGQAVQEAPLAKTE